MDSDGTKRFCSARHHKLTGSSSLEGDRPWNTLSKCRYDVWLVRHIRLALPAPPEKPEGPPVLAVHLAHAVLQCETAVVWDAVSSYTYAANRRALGLDRWSDGVVQRWQTHALLSMELCPDVFHDGLVARLRDAVMQLRIADVFAVNTHDLGWLWRQTRDWHEYAEGQGDPLARPRWAADWSHGLQVSVSDDCGVYNER